MLQVNKTQAHDWRLNPFSPEHSVFCQSGESRQMNLLLLSRSIAKLDLDLGQFATKINLNGISSLCLLWCRTGSSRRAREYTVNNTWRFFEYLKRKRSKMMGKLMNYGFPEEISVKSCNVSLRFLETFAHFYSSIELIPLLRENTSSCLPMNEIFSTSKLH